MSVKVENRSAKIIGIGGINILPNEEKEIPMAYENSPILKIYEKVGHIKITGTPTSTTAEAKTVNDEAAENLRKTRLAMLNGISDEDLGKLANELGINPADCKDQADVLKKVKAALKK